MGIYCEVGGFVRVIYGGKNQRTIERFKAFVSGLGRFTLIND